MSTVSLSRSASIIEANRVMSHLGVAASRRRIAVDRSEIPLPIDQGVSHFEILRHVHDRVVNGHFAVRVVLSYHFPSYPCGLHSWSIMPIVELIHPKQTATVDWFEPVSDVWKSTTNDHAHGVAEIRMSHLVFYEHSYNVRARLTRTCLLYIVAGRCRPLSGLIGVSSSLMHKRSNSGLGRYRGAHTILPS